MTGSGPRQPPVGRERPEVTSAANGAPLDGALRPGSRDRPWHALAAGAVPIALMSDAAAGLSAREARTRLARFGPNALPEAGRRSIAVVFLGQFRSPLIHLLFAAAGIALLLGHRSDAAVIFAVVVINAVIGSIQEGRAERSLESLRRLTSPRARGGGDGPEAVVEGREIVPGDVVLLEAADAVVADARLLESALLQVAEAALTGESMPVPKDPAPLAADTPLADRRNMGPGRRGRADAARSASRRSPAGWAPTSGWPAGWWSATCCRCWSSTGRRSAASSTPCPSASTWCWRRAPPAAWCCG